MNAIFQTGNIVLSGLQTIDTVVVIDGNRISDYADRPMRRLSLSNSEALQCVPYIKNILTFRFEDAEAAADIA